MMSFKGKFLAMSVCVRSEQFTDAKINSHAMLGVIPSTTIKGWLRAGMNRFLIANGINGLHPLPANTISQNNKKCYQQDLALGYLPRDEPGTEDHVIARLFGTLGQLGNLRVNNIYFYPREANGKFKNLQAVFNGRIGYGRVDICRNSPTEQENAVGKYMTAEFLMFHAVEAPLSIGFFKEEPVQEAFTAVAIDYINRHNAECDPRYLLGGLRSFGAGEVAIRLVDNFKSINNTTRLNKEVFKDYLKIVEEKMTVWREVFPLEKNNGNSTDSDCDTPRSEGANKKNTRENGNKKRGKKKQRK